MIYVVSLLTLIFIIAPISLLFHEIGHVIGASLANASSIRLTIGVGKPLWQGNVQNVQIIIRRLFLINSFTSTVRDEPFRNKEKIIITFMGPIFSGLLAAILYMIHYIFVPANLVYLFFLFNVWLVVINLLPFRIGQKQSDGYTIYKLIWNKGSKSEK